MEATEAKKTRRVLTIEEKIAHLRGQAKAKVERARVKFENAKIDAAEAEANYEDAKADLAKLGGEP